MATVFICMFVKVYGVYCLFVLLHHSQHTHLLRYPSSETLGSLQGFSKPAAFCHHPVLRVQPGGLHLCGVLWEGNIKISGVTVLFFSFLLPSGHLHQGFELPGLLQHDKWLSDSPGTQRKRRQKEIGAVEPRDVTWLHCH